LKTSNIGFMTERWDVNNKSGKWLDTRTSFGAVKPSEDHSEDSEDYGRFPLDTSEQNIVDAFIGRTKLIDLLKNLKQDEPELFNEVMEYIVLMNIKSPSGM